MKHGMNRVMGVWRGRVANEHKGQEEKYVGSLQRQMRAIESKAIHNHGKAREAQRAVAIRPMVIDDAAYVIDSWANSFRRSQVVGSVDREVYNIEQRARIDRLISRAASRVFVACDAEMTDKIRGWICFEPPGKAPTPIVHYVCVQPSYQVSGVGTALVGIARQTLADLSQPMWCTHETQPMRHIRPKWNLLYNPYLLEVTDRMAASRQTSAAEGTTNYGF